MCSLMHGNDPCSASGRERIRTTIMVRFENSVALSPLDHPHDSRKLTTESIHSRRDMVLSLLSPFEPLDVVFPVIATPPSVYINLHRLIYKSYVQKYGLLTLHMMELFFDLPVLLWG
jgi:hypothetical protein